MNDRIEPQAMPTWVRGTCGRTPSGYQINLSAPWFFDSKERSSLFALTALVAPVALLWVTATTLALCQLKWGLAALLTAVFVPFLVPVSVPLLRAVEPLTRRCHITVTAGGLSLAEKGWVVNRVKTWAPGEIWAIGQNRGLWVVDKLGRHEFLQVRPEGELIWLAHWLRAVLGVTTIPPAGPNELPIQIGIRRLNDEPGFLIVRPGEIWCRHAFSALRDVWVRPRVLARLRGLRTTLPGTTLWVQPEDIVCVRESEGGWNLHVLMVNDKPGLTLRSPDEEGLPRAVARFWGNQEE